MGLRRIFFLLIVAVAVAFFARAHAAEVSLSTGVKQAIAAAAPLRPPAEDRELFDGRPLLVVFFASW